MALHVPCKGKGNEQVPPGRGPLVVHGGEEALIDTVPNGFACCDG